MASPVTTVSEYFARLARSKLLAPGEVTVLRQAWTGSDADLDGCRKFLVAGRHFTEYQAAMLQRGHADGFVVGGYVILDRIGRGQSAGVYKALHQSGQVVALKVLPGSRAKNPQVLGRFQREGRLLTLLDHPNVVRAFQLGQAGDVSFIAMEHLEGESFDEVLARRKKLPWAEATRVAFQALGGLQHLHEKRMVHRDMKPANLMLTPPRAAGQLDTTLQATVKILDIGLGRELFDDSDFTSVNAGLTQEGAILGTPDYLAPEQARDARAADIRADVYAIGCVLYHGLAGRPPFAEKNLMAQMVKHATLPPDPVTKYAPDVPEGLARAVETMLAKDPADRFQSPAEASRALEPFLPANASPANNPRVLPAYKEYLSTEAELELPDEKKARSVGTTPKPVKSGTVPSPALRQLDDVNVELLPDQPALAIQPVAAPARDSLPAPPSFFPPTRRDWLYFAAGCSVTLSAVGLGFGMAQLARRRPIEEVVDEKKN